ncbi:MAG: hypothetical protein ACW96U_00905 [Candidatus Heimdallarchaeaceae archaeon]|jgi:hypothetical protein
MAYFNTADGATGGLLTATGSSTTTAGDSNSQWIYYPEQEDNNFYEWKWKTNFDNSEIEDLKRELDEIKDKLKKEGIPMKSLYSVIVVDIDGNIVLDTKVVAEDENEAQFAADVHDVLKTKGLKPKSVTIVVEEIAEVKSRKETQKVEIVKEEKE